MRQLSPEGQRVAADLAQRHGFSQEAVEHMMFAVLNGNGTMAQFNHPEFAGAGQWMQGGMMMLGDMFNHSLKGRVDSLCYDIAGVLASQPGLLHSGSFQSQSQGGSSYQHQAAGTPMGQSALFIPNPEDNWWPRELGSPSATGSQNNVRYAYFDSSRRLAVKTGGDVWVYDTLDHQISGFSQQQGMGSSIVFSSQFGPISLGTLPVVSRNGQPVVAPPAASNVGNAANVSTVSNVGSPAGTSDIVDALERLGELRDKGVLTDEEFNAKKSELLSRL